MLLPALSPASAKVRSIDWVAPYTKLLKSQAYEASSTNAESDDWSCFGGESCELCALGTNESQAHKTLDEVVASWNAQSRVSGSARITAVSKVGDRSEARYTAQACVDLALVK